MAWLKLKMVSLQECQPVAHFRGINVLNNFSNLKDSKVEVCKSNEICDNAISLTLNKY